MKSSPVDPQEIRRAIAPGSSIRGPMETLDLPWFWTFPEGH
ncbi:hypothetical protein [Laspinema palackyanum]